MASAFNLPSNQSMCPKAVGFIPWSPHHLASSPHKCFSQCHVFSVFSKSFPFHRVAETGCLDTACIKAFMFCESTSLKPTMDPFGTATSVSIINGHTTGSDLLEVPIPYIRPIFQAYVRGYTPKIWPKIWYSTSILGSWNDHWHYQITIGLMDIDWAAMMKCGSWWYFTNNGEGR